MTSFMPKVPSKAKEYQEKTEHLRSKKKVNFRPRFTENTFSSRSFLTNSISPVKEMSAKDLISIEDDNCQQQQLEHPEITKIRQEFEHL